MRLHVRTLGSFRPGRFPPRLTQGVLSSLRVGLSFGVLARLLACPRARSGSGTSGIAPFSAAPSRVRRPTSHEALAPLRCLQPGAATFDPPALPRAGYAAACRESHPRGDLTPRFTRRIHAPGVSPSRARRSAPCPDLPALFHTGYTLGVGFRSCRGFPSATVAIASRHGGSRSGVRCTPSGREPGWRPDPLLGPGVLFKALPRVSARCPGAACPPSPAAEAPTDHTHTAPRPRRPPLGFAPLPSAPQPEGCGTAGGTVALRSLARRAAGRAPKSPADLHGVLHLVTGPGPEGPRPRRAMKQEPGLWVHLGGHRRVAALRPPLRLRFQR